MEHGITGGRREQEARAVAMSQSVGGSFQGSIGLPLVDLLQAWSLNHFSGMVSVTSLGRAGHIHFANGEVVHAEAEGLVGEPAVRVIMGWREGAFEPFPNTTTLKRTIQKRLDHLLLDVHRELDERRRPLETPAPDGRIPAAPPPLPPRPASVLDQIRALEGVTRLVRFGGDGRPPAGEGAEAEALAAKALYLALNHAGAVAQAFGLRELVVAAVESQREPFVVVHSHGAYLGVGIAEGVAAEPIAARIRALLIRPGAR
jgi:hypothetical protein